MARIRLTLALAVCTLGIAAPATAAGTGAVSNHNALETPLLAQINAFRAAHRLPALRASTRLAAAAQAHAVSMGSEGYFNHTSSDGTVFWKRIRRFYPVGRAAMWTVGENLLWSAAELTPAAALQMWIDSPGHRRILLTAAYRQVGISAVRVARAPGVFGSQPVTIVAADFGVRR